jgi:hypothetical protein
MTFWQWWRRHFNSEGGVEADDFERCSCCGQTYNAGDLQQVLPHFEHQLGLGAEPVTGSLSNESLPSFGNVVPLRRASSRAPSDASTRHLTVVAKAAFTEKQ